MNRRSVNLRDATRQDIIDICSEIEQLFIFYKKEQTPYIYIINLLELLLQSARTRVCILRLPDRNSEKKYTLEEVKKNVVVFANFRDRELYNLFCKKLKDALNKDLIHFFSYELEQIPADQKDLYFCLPRITVRTGEVQLDHSFNREAYHRIRQLLQTMYLERDCWGVDLLNELYHNFTNIPHDSNLNCPETCNAKPIEKIKKLLLHHPKNTDDDELLTPIYEWADYIYNNASESRLLNAAHHESKEDLIDYSNIFFFLRVNKPNTDPGVKNCDSFDVKIICPDQQRKELSLYYHKQQKDHCQWYNNGQCEIHGMPQCEFESHWDNLPPESKHWDNDSIYKSYEAFWEGLDDTRGSSKKTSEAAFRNNSVIFERYAKHKRPDGEKGYFRIDPEARRDRLMACIRYRLLPAPDANSPEEDHVPQVMFVPIYTGGAPFVLAATVINANRPESSARMSEWRMAYRFAGRVLQFFSSRLKEAARKAYLNAAVDMIGQFHEKASKLNNTTDIRETLFHQVNNELETLALAYPYPQILLKKLPNELEKQGDLVNDRDRQTFSLLNYDDLYEIVIDDNRFWCHYSSDKQFFTLTHVGKKLDSALGRNARNKERWRRDNIDGLFKP
uniref:Uncharacterized protein n=1 Tax=uncultured Thiotrichaceae bacterium TaxID=298394 RepID=A0A6S6ULB9_9GAMM|nr:MAG: Unknown protein [uncultured Thiotrichaceae bacterium]